MVEFNVIGFLIDWSTFFAIYAILAVSLNLEIGYTGMANFGKVAFYAIGAYLSAVLTIVSFLTIFGVSAPLYSVDAVIALGQHGAELPWLNVGLFILSLILSAIVAGVVGYLVTYPTLRVGPAFLGITILSFGEMLRFFLRNYEPLGSTYGLFGVPHPFQWVSDPTVRTGIYALIVLGIMFGVYVYAEKLVNSPFGRVLRAIKDDEVAALCLGKHVPRIKATVLFIGSAMAGVAGALYLFYLGSVNPDMFIPRVTFDVWAMVILGGMGNNKGAIVGAAIITFVDRILTFVTPSLGITAYITPDYIRWMIVGLLIVLVLLFKPGGLIPAKPIKTPALEVVEKIEGGEG